MSMHLMTNDAGNAKMCSLRDERLALRMLSGR